MKLHISLAPGFLSFPISAGRKETIDLSKGANMASAYASLAKHLSRGCTEGKSWIIVWRIAHQEMKHLYGSDWLASVEELPKAFSEEGSWACEQQAGLLILGGAISLSGLHFQVGLVRNWGSSLGLQQDPGGVVK